VTRNILKPETACFKGTLKIGDLAQQNFLHGKAHIGDRHPFSQRSLMAS